MSTKSSIATKKQLKKPGQLLAQRFKLACCVNRVGVLLPVAMPLSIAICCRLGTTLTTRIDEKLLWL